MSKLLLETGDALLLETGDALLLEDGSVVAVEGGPSAFALSAMASSPFALEAFENSVLS